MPEIERRQTVDTDPAARAAASPRVRLVVAGVLVVVLVATVAWILGHVNEGRTTDRWERLAEIERTREDFTARSWLDVPMHPDAARSKREHVGKLEELLAREGASDPALAAHLRARLADLELSLALGLADDPTAAAAHQAKAKEHLEALAANHPDAPVNRDRFKPTGAPSVTRLLLRVLEEDRAWQAAHGRKAIEPDATPVVLLRTDQGDLRLRMYSAASPALVKGFLDRAASGAYDGTLIFEKRDETDEGWLRGGDLRARAPASGEITDEMRRTWGEPTAADPLAPEEGRNLIAHRFGTVTSWHPPGDDEGEDPAQFRIVTKDSSRLDYEYAPFARVDDVSRPTLERMFALRSRSSTAASQEARLREQLETPIRVVKVLVYDDGVLRAGGDAGRATDTERRLETVRVDEYKKAEPVKPPTPPATPPAAPPATPPAGAPESPPAPPAAPPTAPPSDTPPK
jgi:cyclophilin family peptidyl-prolyl cis-trans isomerase